MACGVLLLSEKERAPAKAGATNYNKGEDNHAVKVSAVLFTGEPITFHLLISFMDNERLQWLSRSRVRDRMCMEDLFGVLPDKLCTFSWFDAGKMSARFPS
jgi:hypothetical protein